MLLFLYKSTGIRLPHAASAESAAPYASELSTAFVRFSNPNSRQCEQKGYSFLVLRERFLAQAHHQKKRSTIVLLFCKVTGIRLPHAASAESAAPYVSELSTAFVRFSNPNSRQCEEKGYSFLVLRERFLAQAHQQKEKGALLCSFSFW